jgi:hypothetical protein
MSLPCFTDIGYDEIRQLVVRMAEENVLVESELARLANTWRLHVRNSDCAPRWWDLNELHLSNRATKGLKTRYIPLSQERRAMLELRRHDPAGQEFGPDAYVFGNEVGERLNNYQKSWSTLRLCASGHGPHWGSNGKFLPCCRGQLGGWSNTRGITGSCWRRAT